MPSERSIRLLRLDPGTDDEPISFSLKIVESYLSSSRYDALSYCWGDEKAVAEVVCNGEMLAVTKNLCAALHHLRQRGPSNLIWADAICINQNDNSERNQQVSIMNEIYRHASRIFVWIGPGNEDVAEVIAMTRNMAHYIHSSCDPGSPITSWLSTLPANNDKKKVIREASLVKAMNFPHTKWQSFWHFYQADWFFRVWVIQEVRQQLDVWLLCGDSEIEWNFVGLATSWAWLQAGRDIETHWTKDHFISLAGFANANLMWDQTLSTRRQAPFLAILHLARGFRATDPRDKVFAMLHHCIKQLVADKHDQLIEKRLYPVKLQNVSTHRFQQVFEVSSLDD